MLRNFLEEHNIKRKDKMSEKYSGVTAEIPQVRNKKRTKTE